MSSLPVDIVHSALEFLFKTTDGRLPFIRPLNDGSGMSSINYELKEEVVKIENIRGKEHHFTLDMSGFQFYRCDTRHITFATKEQFENEYISEAVELTKRLTGAQKVVPFEPVLRRHTRETDPNSTPQPVKLAHIDQTSRGALAAARQYVLADELDDLLKGRFQVVNLWRPITHAALDRPLAVCDYRSIDSEKDLVPFEFTYSGRVVEMYVMKYNPHHQWKYFRGMDIDEVLLFKCFDSIDTPGLAKFSGHASFEDPTAPDSVPLRESVEVRMLVFYGK